MSEWGTTDFLQQAADQVTVLLAGPVPRVQAWYMAISADARFRVTMQANDPSDLTSKLITRPDVLVIDAAIFSGLTPTVNALTAYSGLAYVLLPSAADQHAYDTVAQIPCVKGVWKGDLNLASLTGKIYGDVQATRQSAVAALSSVWSSPSAPGQTATGLRVIAVWNQAGGVGKTTVSTNLAYDAARRGLPTLLIGLGAPDDLPLVLGLRPVPNITAWRSNPTAEGLKASLQKLDTLDVLAGFPDVLSEAQAINTPLDDPTSLARLVVTAAYSGYAVIVLDAPPTALASSAIAAANTLVLVARPSLEGIMRTVEAYRTVVERLAGEHRIPANGVYVVLNRMGNRMTADEWHKGASALLGRAFPPIVAQIPDDPQVGETQDSRRLPLNLSDSFARGLKPLADMLYAGGQLNLPQNKNGKGKTINLFGVRVKL
jgi:cellulose biosynthesis protein BcsQ